jgi:acyl carrier protein phosphodiesterase
MEVMFRENWLWSYRTVEGIDKILTQMDRRTKNQSQMRTATEELERFYPEFENEFTLFFEELRAHVSDKQKEFSQI